MTLKFLLLEDNCVDADLIQVTLHNGGINCEILKAKNHSDFISALQTNKFDLIVANSALSGVDGLSVLEIARNLCPALPLIFVCTTLGEELVLDALERGATGFVLKHRLERLVPCVHQALRDAHERQECHRAKLLLVEQKRLLESIALGHPLDGCLSSVCDSLSRLNGGTRACFLLSDAQRTTFPRSIAPNFPPSFGEGLKDAPINDLCIGTCGEAVYRGKPITCSDIANDHRWSQEWRNLCVAHGIFACHSKPVKGFDGQPLGSLMLCFDEARMPSDWEYQLADFGTQVASIAFERERSNLALRESEAKYRTLFQSIDEGFCICEMLFDENGEPYDYRFVEVNGMFAKLTGLEQAIGKTARELVPNLEAFWVETYGRVVQMGEAIRFEQQSLVMNRWFDVYAFCINESQNHQFGILFTNISERKKVERERERFLAVGSDLQVITGSNGYCKWVSPSFESILGWTSEEMLSRPWTEFVHPDDISASVTEADSLFCGNETFKFENRYRHKDDSYRWLLWNAQLCADNQLLYGTAIDITERKVAEEALRESEELKQRILESSNDCIKVLNLDGEILYINTGGLGLLKIDELTLVLNTNWVDFWHDEERERVKTALAAAKAGNTSRFQGYCPTRKNCPKWWDSIITPIFDASGIVTQLVVISRDITQQKQAEDRLRDSEERFRNMADHAPFMVWMTDATGYCTYLSQSWYNFSGQNQQTGLGYGWLDAVHPEEREYAERTFKAANEHQEAFSLEYRLQRQDGEYIWAIDAATPWFGVDGQYKGYIGSVIDVSERKQAEIALRERESYLRLILESAKDYAIITLDSNGKIASWNSGAERLLGYTEAEALGSEGRMIFTPEDNQQRRAEWEMYTALTQGRAENERWHIRQDGSRFWGSGLMMPLLTEVGVVQGFVKIMQDKTTQRQTEAQREQLLQLEQVAREQAETANRIKDEFLAVLSHELRSPLNPILGWAQLLRSGKLDAFQTAQGLETIERNAKRQTQLIEDLLDISRIVRGKLVLNLAPVDLAIPIASAIETVQLAAQAKGIEIKRSVPAKMAYILGDSNRLQQIVWNLLSNAVKFTPPAGRVEIRLEQVGNEAQIRVKDTGKGINREFLPHVFDYFRQEDGKTTRQFGGLGLGLAIVRQLTELHGGTVAVESLGEGLGATFTVRFPLLKNENTQVEERANNSLLLASDSSSLTGVKILVVDDEADMQDLTSAILASSGASVMVTASAAEALEIFDSFKPDVLISDIGMPQMDGYMLMRQVRALPPEQGGQIPAIALTAYAGEIDYQQAMSAGFQKHIPKPVEPDKLVEAIANLVKQLE